MKIRQELCLILNQVNHNTPAEKLKDIEIYAQWLAQTYFFVRHSTSLLGLAMPYIKNEELRHRFEKHIGEEERHDKLLLKDLEKLGHSISEFQEWPMTQAFYQGQYYRIQFECGSSVLGYILFLEGLAAGWGLDLYHSLKNLFPQSVLFAKIHAEEDPGHVDQALKAIESLPKHEQEIIINNLKYSHEIYQRMLNKMIEQSNMAKAA
jgi:hypothetical protein